MSSFIPFIILIGVLIFVHELGHFLSGKMLGVKILTFSLGFPPRLLGKRIGETEYVLGAIPLGGYVKFLGEDASDEVTKEEMARAFHVQPLWKRLVIVLAGPVMNLVFPVFIYFIVLSFQPKIVPAVVGMVVPGSPAEKSGLLPGDTIVEIEGKTIRGFEDMIDVVGSRPGRTVTITFMRDGKRMETTATVEKATDVMEALDLRTEVGRIGVDARTRSPMIQVLDAESAAYRAGLRTGDLVLTFGGKRIARWSDLEKAPVKPGARIDVQLLHPREVATPLGSIFIYYPRSFALDVPGDGGGGLVALGIDSTELFIHTVTEGSVADRIGVRPGDEVVALNDEPVRVWDQLRTTLQTYPEAYHDITLRRPDGSLLTARFRMVKRTIEDELKQKKFQYEFGALNNALYVGPELIPNPNPITRGIKGAMKETESAISLTFIGIVRIIQGRISFKTMGGPIMIFDIAGRAARQGTGSFLRIMALISINLGIINLAPIPMLDGGMITLFLFEAVTRRTPGQRFRLIYQYIGLALIGLLIIFVFKNDIERYWDNIVGFFKGA